MPLKPKPKIERIKDLRDIIKTEDFLKNAASKLACGGISYFIGLIIGPVSIFSSQVTDYAVHKLMGTCKSFENDLIEILLGKSADGKFLNVGEFWTGIKKEGLKRGAIIEVSGLLSPYAPFIPAHPMSRPGYTIEGWESLGELETEDTEEYDVRDGIIYGDRVVRLSKTKNKKYYAGLYSHDYGISNISIPLLVDSLPVGKGGELHKQLQAIIKEQAEVFGWKANIEERIPHSLESVDVGLRKDDIRVAIEVSATTYPEQELQNIRKCLNAGYDYVISVSSDEKNLLSIKKEARKVFTLRDRERIRFSLPSQVKEYLKGIASTGIVSEKGIVSDQIKNQKELMGTKEASEFLGIKKQTLYEWVVQMKIPFIKVGRLTKFRRSDLEAWLKKRTREEEDHFL